MAETVVIKNVDPEAYKLLKAKAARRGLRLGDAATEASRVWARGEQ